MLHVRCGLGVTQCSCVQTVLQKQCGDVLSVSLGKRGDVCFLIRKDEALENRTSLFSQYTSLRCALNATLIKSW